jgi:NADH-quinone oxidoreductase subunit F
MENIETMQILRKTGFKAYEKALDLGAKQVIELIKHKKLTGRGGAGFSTGEKLSQVYDAPGNEKYVICNADEGEPGTFKDKFVINNNIEALIEGIFIACFIVKAKKAFIYLRGEYDYLESKLNKAIKDAKLKTRFNLDITIVVGAGAYICGDETAIISSIQNERGLARLKPPFPTSCGLYGKPTLIDNVETLANVPLALLYDDWDANLRLYSISGNVSKPGVYEAPLGIKLNELLSKAEPENKIKAVFFGCFGGCMPYSDMEVRPENICDRECLLGSCTIIAVDEKHSIVDVCKVIAKFYEFESCGKCTPCREGTLRILELMNKIVEGNATEKDLDTLQEIAEVVKETSFCALGQTATQHILTALNYFKNEFEAKVK